VLVNTKKFLTSVAVASALSVAGWSQAQQGQTPQAQTPQGQTPQAQAEQGKTAQPAKQYKEGEYDAYNAVVKETDPKKKLALLDAWKQKFPQTDYKKDRLLHYLDTYKNLNQAEKMLGTAKEIITDDPKDFTALYWIATIVPTLPKAAENAEYVELAAKAGRGLLDNMDDTLGDAKRPASTPEAEWKKGRTNMEALAYKTLGWSAMAKKDAAGAKQNFTKVLELSPAAGEVSYWLGLTILGEKDPKTYPIGLYHVARAATYDGPGALAPAIRPQVNDYLSKAYKGFHGDDSGLEQIKAQTKANALPPPDFKIPSVKEIAEAKQKQEAEDEAKDPLAATWKRLYEALTAPDGQQYFDSGVKDAEVPPLRGYLVSHTSKSIVLALSDKTTPQVTLQLETPIAGKAEPGTALDFTGVAKTMTPQPFMLTLETEKSKIKGWPAAPAKKPAGSKKPRRK
jgi:hypothetical protein